jgi:hypothetical protein
LSNQSSTDGLVLVVRYSVVPMRGVGSAVIGVRITSQSSKNAPKPRAVVLNTACICARSEKLVPMPACQMRMLIGSISSGGGSVSPRAASMLAMVWAKLLM